MSGISVQVGPRSTACLGVALARPAVRSWFITGLVVASVAVQVALFVTLVLPRLHGPAQQVFVPRAFCPAGQHVVSGDAAGWPLCQANH